MLFSANGAHSAGKGAPEWEEVPSLWESSVTKSIAVSIFHLPVLVSIPPSSSLPLEHTNLSKRKKKICIGKRTPETWVLVGLVGKSCGLSGSCFPPVWGCKRGCSLLKSVLWDGFSIPYISFWEPCPPLYFHLLFSPDEFLPSAFRHLQILTT